MSAMTLAQYTGENAKLWDIPAPAPVSTEPVLCPSKMPLPSSVTGFVVCDVDHAELSNEAHAALVNGHHFRWSTRQAAAAWLAVDRCANTYCGQIVPPGQPYCSAWCTWQDKNATDQHDTESEAA